MIAPDANLLIYAVDAVSPFHAASRDWLESLLNSSDFVGLPCLSLYGFLRFVTSARVGRTPMSFATATSYINSWLDLPNVRILYPGDRHWPLMQDLATRVRIQGNLVTDAAIAAIVMEYGAVLHTHDRDFARFPGLRWSDPLSA